MNVNFNGSAIQTQCSNCNEFFNALLYRENICKACLGILEKDSSFCAERYNKIVTHLERYWEGILPETHWGLYEGREFTFDAVIDIYLRAALIDNQMNDDFSGKIDSLAHAMKNEALNLCDTKELSAEVVLKRAKTFKNLRCFVRDDGQICFGRTFGTLIELIEDDKRASETHFGTVYAIAYLNLGRSIIELAQRWKKFEEGPERITASF